MIKGGRKFIVFLVALLLSLYVWFTLRDFDCCSHTLAEFMTTPLILCVKASIPSVLPQALLPYAIIKKRDISELIVCFLWTDHNTLVK